MTGIVERLIKFIRTAFAETLTSATQLGVFEEFAPPHTVAPRLTVVEAAIASLAALVRIFTGSLLFAFWGVAMWLTWAKTGNALLRILAVLPEAALFLFTLVLSQAVISMLVKSRWPGVR